MSLRNIVVGCVVLAACSTASEASAVQARRTVGVYAGWAAFVEGDPRRCYAIAVPLVPRSGASASVGNWPAMRAANQFHVRFDRPMRSGTAILLNIDDRVFQLRGRGVDAWAPDAATDRAIASAMRTGVRMTASARDERGSAQVDAYALSGAASAIDAAALACR